MCFHEGPLAQIGDLPTHSTEAGDFGICNSGLPHGTILTMEDMEEK